MLKRITSVALAALIATMLTSCLLDPDKQEKVDDPPQVDYKDLTEEWHVLYNLALAYDNKNIDRYAELFDRDNFVFFFNPGDVGTDGVPQQWNYLSEIQSARNMFNRVGGLDDNPITTIDLTLFDIEDVVWQNDESEDFPGETLRKVTINYTFTIDTINDHTYVSPTTTPRAQFIVRNIDGKFKLVQWFDLEG